MSNFNEGKTLSSRSSFDGLAPPTNGTATPRSVRESRLGRHKSSFIFDSLPPPSPVWSPAPSIAPMSGQTTAYPSRQVSRRNSMTSMRSYTSHNMMDEIKHEAMVNYLFQQQCKKLWVGSGEGSIEGVLVRKSRGNYAACPPALNESTLAHYSTAINLPVVLTVNSRVIQTFVQFSPDAVSIPFGKGLNIQILPSLDDLPKARKNQGAAYLAAEQLLLVWDDDPNNIFARAVAIEDELMALVWQSGNEEVVEDSDKPKGPAVVEVEIDEETGELKPENRPTNLINACLVSLTLVIIMAMMGSAFRAIALQIMVDNSYIRMCFLLMIPIQVFFTLFFAQAIVGSIAQMIGPIKQMKGNSKFYSALLPRRITGKLPHVTVQCPVYKEGLASVIAPTVKSIKAAMATYELQGGSANILINDDGLQLIDEEERQARIEFYQDHSIGWTARPKHGEDGFVRKGKFKKASNMNFGLMLSNNVEDKLVQLQRDEKWSQDDEAREYARCLKEVVEEDGRAWADGNIRIGDYIILIDSDTRVPVDCFLDAVSEMEQCPEVGIMQFSSGVMQVVHDYFENGITFFTNLIYTAIQFGTSNGDVAPFVGHNAILRWSAVQQVSYFDEDGYEKFWSESHVSEDFDMALRLQVNGYIIRLAAWAGDGFKEGVSLTVYDELARWEKYAYGCSELLFHPIRFWIVRGPFTPLFRQFLCSNIPFTSKVTITSYIGTYYAIGAAWIMTTANYFAVGWFSGYLDKYYLDSWKVWFSVIIVFTGIGNVALATMRYRIGDRSFLGSLFENIKWIIMMAIFLGGISVHVSSALLAHMFEYDMQWGATSKEAEFSNFFIEVPKVLKRFKYSLTISLLFIVGMIVLATAPFIPYGWEIKDFVAILPMATVWGSHFLLPIALNPALMTFTF